MYKSCILVPQKGIEATTTECPKNLHLFKNAVFFFVLFFFDFETM